MNFYPDSSNIDLREEMHAVLYGRSDVVPQGRKVALREVTNTTCSCWDGLNGGPIQDCPYCKGVGYQFRERLLTVFIARGVAPVYKPGYLGTGDFPLNPYGYDDPNRATGFADYKAFPNYERYTIQTHKSMDRILELKVKEEGGLSYPLTYTAEWKLVNLIPFFGDNGRIEYFELGLAKENV
jgi:hypothetical protein